eukprot:TRINITY_DN4823_c0_g2_i3.p2 TRINITY_DN4823_c0_g2~~TRINITY_DN4823_c0_g2_i3.p2  ORF type:complete len:141 (+),score=48.84 TRINITY_DN4823_c0_g2_i3:125-547(+)
MDPEAVKEMKIVFGRISKGAKTINKAQLEELLYVLGCKPLLKEPYISEINSVMKGNKATLDDLQSKLNAMMTTDCRRDEIKEALTVFDEEGKGKISKQELKRALTTYSSLPPGEIDALLNMGKGGDLIDAEEVLNKLFIK